MPSTSIWVVWIYIRTPSNGHDYPLEAVKRQEMNTPKAERF